MGRYPSRLRPAPPASALLSGDRRERPERRGPPARRLRSADPTLEPARRLSPEELVASPRRRWHRRLFVIVRRRQCPVQQARCLFLGVFSSVSRSGPQKPVPSACSSKKSCTSLILKMASAEGKVTLRLALKQTLIRMWSSLSGHLPNPCVKETLVRALEERGQLRAEKEKDLTALAESRKGLAKRKEGHLCPESLEDQRRGPGSSGGGQSAFRRLMVNGVLSSFVPRPGPLGKDFCFNSSEDSLIKKSQSYVLRSCSKRHAIISSYSSARGFPPLQRSGPGAVGLRGPASSRPHVPAKKASEESHQSRSSASVEPQSQIKREKAADAASGQKQNLRESPPFNSPRPRKRKIPLLLPSRRNGPLILPPAPQLGYRVTAEDLDLEKRAAIQWINKVLEGDVPGHH